MLQAALAHSRSGRAVLLPALSSRHALHRRGKTQAAWLKPRDDYMRRHLGPTVQEREEMLSVLGLKSLDELAAQTVPKSIAIKKSDLNYDAIPGCTESEALERLHEFGKKNTVAKTYIGMGYYGCIIPPVIQRNILENPGWYTPYTPYQPEISQGRMESLINFQTMVQDLTGMEISNASLLDEGTAAAEAMNMCHTIAKADKNRFFIDANCHPQTIAVVKGRAESIGVEVVVADPAKFDFSKQDVNGVLLQYPNTYGTIADIGAFVKHAHANGALVTCATDLLALTMLKPPGEFDCDIVVGCAQRFGTPLGYGGPHAGFLATRDEHTRRMPGRLIGVSKDAHGAMAYRLAIQTRETHIRRERATSNICTAQALLANMSAMYGVYHGPGGLKAIGNRVHQMTCALAEAVTNAGHTVLNDHFFDTIHVSVAGGNKELLALASKHNINLRVINDKEVGVSLAETTTPRDLHELMNLFSYSRGGLSEEEFAAATAEEPVSRIPADLVRTSEYMTHPNFNKYHSETGLMRYCKYLENKDVSLVHSMIPLGSCTMKLNSATTLRALTNRQFTDIHPFVPVDQATGYHEMLDELRKFLCEVSGYDEVSLQPHSGATGELAGLMAINAYHKSRGDHARNICITPVSAHGTNPASATLAGLKVAKVNAERGGEIDVDDLRKQCEKHKGKIAAIMITYPSTYGVFDENVREVCDIVHEHGGQVYLDGANLNAQLYLCKPGHYGADVSHFNLHKTFCIPHGGGGPGMGPIGVRKHLAPFLPSHPLVATPAGQGSPVAAAPFGSALIGSISWLYITMAGVEGLRDSALYSILAANYMATKLKQHYPTRFLGRNGRCAHEFIIDFSQFKKIGITCMDVAKRLQDYGFHPPTVSWPVDGALMIEPTECENKDELDRYIDALVTIRQEIREIEQGVYSKEDNPIVNAPHSLRSIIGEEWKRPYTIEKAAYPLPWLKKAKYFPSVSRLDDAFGDLNLVCSCPPMDSYE